MILISRYTLADLEGPKENIIYTIDDVRGEILRPPACTLLAAVIANKNQKCVPLRAMIICIKKEEGSYRGFGYPIIISDPINLVKRAREKFFNFENFHKTVDSKTRTNQIEAKYL